MTALDAILLGALQGITEFLPISSSGHLVIAQSVMGISPSGILFEVIVHLGTLLSILVVFSRDIRILMNTWSSEKSQKFFIYLLLATLPIAVAGLLWKGQIEAAFHDIRLVGVSFLLTGTVLLSTRFLGNRRSFIDGKKSLLIGIGQALALLPGISRSGLTISSGLMLGLEAREAAKFSFLLAIPALAGSGILMMLDFLSLREDTASLWVMCGGLATSFVVGVVSLKLLLNILFSGRFHWFGLYCLVVGFLALGM